MGVIRKKRRTLFRMQHEKNLEILESGDIGNILLFDENGKSYEISTSFDDAIDILINGNLQQEFACCKVDKMSVEEKLITLIRLEAIENFFDVKNEKHWNLRHYKEFIEDPAVKELVERQEFQNKLIEYKATEEINPNNVTFICAPIKYEKIVDSDEGKRILAKGYKIKSFAMEYIKSGMNWKDNTLSLSFTELFSEVGYVEVDQISNVFRDRIPPNYKKVISPDAPPDEIKLNDHNMTGLIFVTDLVVNDYDFRHAFMNLEKQHSLWVKTLKDFLDEINHEGYAKISKSNINVVDLNQDRTAFKQFVKDKVAICRKTIEEYWPEKEFFADAEIGEGILKFINKHYPRVEFIKSDLRFMNEKLWSINSTGTKSVENMVNSLLTCKRIPPILVDYFNSKLKAVYKDKKLLIKDSTDPEVRKKEIEKIVLLIAYTNKIKNILR